MKLSASFIRAALVAVLGLGIAAVPVLASAQDAGAADHGFRSDCHGHGFRGHHRGHEMRRMLSQLDLTANQQAEIKAILQTQRQRAQQIRAQGPSEQTRDAFWALRKETRRLVREALTPAQQAKLDQLQAARRAEKLDHVVARMTEGLSLSSTQARQVRNILEKAQARRQQILQSHRGDDAQRAAMQTLRQRTRDAMGQVLTPDQRAKLQQFWQHRHGHHGGAGSWGGPDGR